MAPLHATNRNQNRIGLVNGIAGWIHHVGRRAGFARQRLYSVNAPPHG
jgi:hypothetical protein